MNMMFYRSISLRVLRDLRRIKQGGWPTMLAACLIVGSVVALISAWFVRNEVHTVSRSTSVMYRKHIQSGKKVTPALDPFPGIPEDSKYLDDLGEIFKTAKASDVVLGVAEYKAERHSKLPLMIRSVEFKVKGDYPKAKKFISNVLTDFPYVSLQEIRIERADGTAVQGALLIRMILVYKASSFWKDVTSVSVDDQALPNAKK